MTDLPFTRIFVALLVTSGPAIAQPVEIPDLGEMAPLVPTASESDRPLAIRSNDYSPAAEAIDFGEIPAVQLHELHRYMNFENRIYLTLKNSSQQPVTIAAVRFVQLETEEPTMPFDRCTPEEAAPVTLAPGEYTFDMLCFFPVTESTSAAAVEFLNPLGEVVASARLRGTGRALIPDEPLPMGVMSVPEGHFTNPGKEKAADITEFGVFIDDELQAIPSTFEVTNGGCTGAIVGGGLVPNPAITPVGGGRMANANNLGVNQGAPGDEINVGQYVRLLADLNCGQPAGIVTGVQWTVGGMAVKDYDESLGTGTVTTTPHTAADLTARTLDLYWQRPGTHTMQVVIDYIRAGAPGQITVTRNFTIEINNTDLNRQMEDFYVWNHNGRVLGQHVGWHAANRAWRCRSVGADFFVFHRNMLGSANGWRQTFGPYAAIVAYNPAGAIPNGPSIDHNGRARQNPNLPMPSYYTRAGGLGVAACGGFRRLKQFPSVDSLAHQMEASWHGAVHVQIGGDMRSPATSPKDPVFYRWHKKVDDVYQDYLNP